MSAVFDWLGWSSRKESNASFAKVQKSLRFVELFHGQIKEKADGFHKENEKLRNEVKELKNKFDSVLTRCEESIREQTSLREKVAELGLHKENLKKAIEELKADVDGSGDRAHDFSSIIKVKDEDIMKLTEQANHANDLTKEVLTLSSENEQLRSQLQEVQRQANHAKDLTKEVLTLSSENEQLRSQLQEVQRNAEKLQEELERAKQLQNTVKLQNESAKRHPNVLSMKFQGEPSTDHTSNVEDFFKERYVEVLDEAEDLKRSEVGYLLNGLSKLYYETAKEAILDKAKSNLRELFQYQPTALTSTKEKLADTSHAYGLLLCHCQKDISHEDLLQSIDEQIDEKEELRSLAAKTGNEKQLIQEFRDELHKQVVNMITISPPLVWHNQDRFDENRMEKTFGKDIGSAQPLLWIRPTIMESYAGKVFVKGIVGNEEDIKRCDDQH